MVNAPGWAYQSVTIEVTADDDEIEDELNRFGIGLVTKAGISSQPFPLLKMERPTASGTSSRDRSARCLSRVRVGGKAGR